MIFYGKTFSEKCVEDKGRRYDSDVQSLKRHAIAERHAGMIDGIMLVTPGLTREDAERVYDKACHSNRRSSPSLQQGGKG